MLKIEGCTEEECRIIEETARILGGALWFRLVEASGDLSVAGHAFLAGLRTVRISEEAQEALDAVVSWATPGSGIYWETSPLTAAVKPYLASLAPPVDVEKLHCRVQDLALEFASEAAPGYPFKTHEELVQAYKDAEKSLADATALKPETRREAAEKVCEFMSRSDFKDWLPLRALLDNWEAVKSR